MLLTPSNKAVVWMPLDKQMKILLNVTYSQQFHDELTFFFILVLVFFLHFFHFTLQNKKHFWLEKFSSKKMLRHVYKEKPLL